MLPPWRSPCLVHERQGHMCASLGRSGFTLTGLLHVAPWSRLDVYIGTSLVLSMYRTWMWPCLSMATFVPGLVSAPPSYESGPAIVLSGAFPGTIVVGPVQVCPLSWLA